MTEVSVAVVVPLKIPNVPAEVDALVDRFTVSALRYLTALGVEPLVVDVSAERVVPLETVLRCDGIVLLGGGDIDPELYGHVGEVPNSYGVDRQADDYSLELVRKARARGLAILGICRGSQVINVASGGTLVPDIEDPRLHRGLPPDETFLHEKVLLEDGSRLSQAFGCSSLSVRNGHHQAVKHVASGFLVAARAEDGIIEGIEALEGWCVGVQWHPEDRDGSAEDAQTLFAAFVDEIRRAASGGSSRRDLHRE